MVELPSPQPCKMNAGSVKDATFQGLMASTFHGGNVAAQKHITSRAIFFEMVVFVGGL